MTSGVDAWSDYRLPCCGEPVERWLTNTGLLQHDHPRVRLQALKLTQLHCTETAKALACFTFVRALPFRSQGDPAHTPSLEVLACGCGDGHTKSTLFVALLRSLGIPARVRLVRLPTAYLHGLLDAPGPAVDHAISELFLQGCWLGVDSYAVDPTLGLAARSRLLRERRLCGWGVHLKGQFDWNGDRSSFGQFSCADPHSVPVQDLGVFDEVGQFWSSTYGGPAAWARQLRSAAHAVWINHRLRNLRQAASAAGA